MYSNPSEGEKVTSFSDSEEVYWMSITGDEADSGTNSVDGHTVPISEVVSYCWSKSH